MKVTIVGAGNMGRGIGTRVVAGGHEVEVADRDPAKAQKLADELGSSATALDAPSRFGGEVVVLALYYPGITDAVRRYADQLAGKVVVTSPTRSIPRPGTAWRQLQAAPLPRSSRTLPRRERPW